jgi:hypothetical protein
MGRKLNYVSVDRILSKVYRDLGLEEISESDVIEWVGESLEHIGAITLYEESVAFIEIENHQADLPNGLHSIIQVAKNNRWIKSTKDICPANVILDCSTEEISSPDNSCGCLSNSALPEGSPIPLDCNGTPIIDYEMAYYRPYFDLQYEYHGWMKSNLYQQEYTPVRLANHTFFNTVVCDEDPKIYCPSCGVSDEYTLVGDKIRTSFKEGSIALAYYRQKIDSETGYPMIPDEVSVISAITYYITWKYMARMWYMGREGYADKMQVAEQQWQWYCKQAGNKQMMLYGVDQHQNFTDGRFQLIPRKNKYYGFFGKLGRAEDTGFKDPNKRNFRLRGI